MMIHKLNNLAKDKKVDILFACESGSRAWGFASPDSDYDVRFVYTHPLDWYLSVSEKKDTIDIMDGDFDTVGWELRKKLRLLKKSNVPALEHLFSPITYIEESESIKELRTIAEDCFSSIACMYHYLSMSKKYEEKLTDEKVKLKSLFYALRTALAGKWILEHNTMPPVVFSKMLSLVKKDEEDEIRNLMAIKSENNESYLHSRNEKVIELITRVICTNEKYAKSLSGGKPDTDRIDSFLYKTLTK
ncbi:nucleotidyltransferase domain-containing protein [Maribacter sp. BPC-D8]|uniref:nucleotidyltransferase domain-containing protein n=1 Tax=Maribacter sp. BPC-D8 TaxID=3053613 RepID=UPI002B49B40A|nr:nucleotidyltransferase domain-containing protein [Maribacter sp. BPC-D8]WRI30023.1 nucleotidyltransferase domain-containing protein [Maribacter sp. BPC-D8]